MKLWQFVGIAVGMACGGGNHSGSTAPDGESHRWEQRAQGKFAQQLSAFASARGDVAKSRAVLGLVSFVATVPDTRVAVLQSRLARDWCKPELQSVVVPYLFKLARQSRDRWQSAVAAFRAQCQRPTVQPATIVGILETARAGHFEARSGTDVYLALQAITSPFGGEVARHTGASPRGMVGVGAMEEACLTGDTSPLRIDASYCVAIGIGTRRRNPQRTNLIATAGAWTTTAECVMSGHTGTVGAAVDQLAAFARCNGNGGLASAATPLGQASISFLAAGGGVTTTRDVWGGGKVTTTEQPEQWKDGVGTQQTTEVTTDAKGTVTDTTVTTVTHTGHDESSENWTIETRSTDANGRLTYYEVRDQSSGDRSSYRAEYDTNGTLVKDRVTEIDGATQETKEQTTTYNSDGTKTVVTTSTTADGKSTTSKATYDKDGNKTSETEPVTSQTSTPAPDDIDPRTAACLDEVFPELARGGTRVDVSKLDMTIDPSPDSTPMTSDSCLAGLSTGTVGASKCQMAILCAEGTADDQCRCTSSSGGQVHAGGINHCASVDCGDGGSCDGGTGHCVSDRGTIVPGTWKPPGLGPIDPHALEQLKRLRGH